MVAECSIRFELGFCAVVHGSSCPRFNSVGPKCTSLSLDCSWLSCFERKSYRRMCHVAMVMVVLQSDCNTAPVVSAPPKCFL